jgi:hypothetical protein
MRNGIRNSVGLVTLKTPQLPVHLIAEYMGVIKRPAESGKDQVSSFLTHELSCGFLTVQSGARTDGGFDEDDVDWDDY